LTLKDLQLLRLLGRNARECGGQESSDSEEVCGLHIEFEDKMVYCVAVVWYGFVNIAGR